MKDMPITMQPDGWLGQTGGYAKDMTLRQYIAIKAMQGFVTAAGADIDFFDAAEDSYRMADAMLQVGND